MAAQQSIHSNEAAMTAQLRGTVLNNEPMARHCSWRCGGRAKRYFVPVDLADIQTMLQQLPDDENILWLGLGSNLLVRDAGFAGTVIATQNVMKQLEMKDTNTVYVGAGVAGAKLARFSTRHQLSGGEFFAGIPGLVGGALTMNAGAFGGETWRQVLSVETLDRSAVLHTRTAADYEIAYRHVQLKNPVQAEWFVAATMRFVSQDSAQPQVLDIKQLLAKRAATQPTGSASCGSVFRNPAGDFAARLIESCGLKGKRIGGAVVSEKHANFILNDKDASAADIEALISEVQAEVLSARGVELQTEVRIVGERTE